MLNKGKSKVEGRKVKSPANLDPAISENRRCLTYLIILSILVSTCFALLFAIRKFQPNSYYVTKSSKITLPAPIFRQHESASSLFPGYPKDLPASLTNNTKTESLSSAPTSNHIDAEIAVNRIDPDYDEWKSRVSAKLGCLLNRRLAFYLYHVRKAAGTTIRDVTRLIAFRQRVPFYETEGIVLNESLLDIKQLFTMITFRDPIARIFSLYWYEHVGWFSGVLKQPHRCKTLQEWISAWKDGSAHKESILLKFPSNNYIEIENYYVKLLIGYNHNDKRALTSADLEKAKTVLKKFDLILITEWLSDETENKLLHSLYQHFYLLNTNREIVIPQKVKGDMKLQTEMAHQLVPNKVSFVPYIYSSTISHTL